MASASNTTTIETLLFHLNIIGSIQKNDRINTTNGFQVQKSPFQSFVRWYRNENRDTNLDAIRDLITDALKQCDVLLCVRDKLKTTTPVDKIKMLANEQSIDAIVKEIKFALSGLASLAFTYSTSSEVVARIYALNTTTNHALKRIEVRRAPPIKSTCV